jgi:hypothetical protein
MALCRKCGLTLGEGGLSMCAVYPDGRTDYTRWVGACPGSRENLNRWPTYDALTRDKGDLHLRTNPTNDFAHEPISELEVYVNGC